MSDLDNKEMNLIEEVNRELLADKSIADIEKSKGFGKDTLRKKLRKLNYRYDRKLKQYVRETTDNTKNKVITVS